MGSSENKQAAATFSFQIRTDLALEDKESFEGDGGEIPGVVLKERTRKEGAVRMTEVKILNAQGARAMGKPEGTYLTLEADELQTPDEDCHSRVVDELAMQLNELMKRAGWGEKGKSVPAGGRPWKPIRNPGFFRTPNRGKSQSDRPSFCGQDREETALSMPLRLLQALWPRRGWKRLRFCMGS